VRLRLAPSAAFAEDLVARPLADAALSLLQTSYYPSDGFGRCPPAGVSPSPPARPAVRTPDGWLTNAWGDSPSALAAAYPPNSQSATCGFVYVSYQGSSYLGSPKPVGTNSKHTVGKWMHLGIPHLKLDRAFVEVAKAVEAGEVISAKAPAGIAKDSKAGLIILYTNDFRDRDDVTRAGVAIKRRLGTGVELRYKCDVFTRNERYATAGAGGKTCCYTMRSGSLSLEVDETVYAEAVAYVAEAVRATSTNAVAVVGGDSRSSAHETEVIGGDAWASAGGGNRLGGGGKSGTGIKAGAGARAGTGAGSGVGSEAGVGAVLNPKT